MGDRTEKLILLPRYTTLCGADGRFYYSKPVPARRYAQAEICAWRSVGLGSPTPILRIEQSHDLVRWFAADTDLTLTNGDEEVIGSFGFVADWFRVRVSLGGSNAACTLWAVGDFVVREGA